MKAKMSNKPPEAANYMCMKCNKEFSFNSGELTCPSCGNAKRNELVPIDVRNSASEETMYTQDDFLPG